MKTYEIAKKVTFGRLQWVAYALLALILLALLLCLLTPHAQGSTVVIFVNGKQVAEYALADTVRTVKYNGIEVRIYDQKVQTAIDGVDGGTIFRIGDVLAYPAEGITISIR